MHRLAGSDAGFLFIEGPSQTSTCVDLVVIDPAPDGRPVMLDELRERIAARLHLTPGLRRRMRPVPLGLGHGIWVDDADFDLDHHLSRVVLPAPGGEEELRDLMSQALPVLLDRERPVWRLTLVDGLDHGRQALLFQFHHTLADGAGLVETMFRLLDDRAEDAVQAPALSGWQPERDPGAALLLVATLWRQLIAWLAVPLLLVRTVRRFRAVERRKTSAEVAVPGSMGAAPRSLLNRSADDARGFARATLPMSQVRAVRSAADCTVSDVALSVVAGALRGYLIKRGELPDEPLVVNVPVGNDKPGAAARTTGNVFSNYFALLATDIEDPRSRLEAVTAAAAEAKLQLELQGKDTLPDWIDRIPPALATRVAARLAARQREGRAAPDFNVLVSNMRVSNSPWSWGGRLVHDLFMSGPVADGAGLNITITGYGDHLTMALTVNPASVDDPVELATRLESALEELVEIYTGSGAVGPSGGGRGEVA